MPEPPTPTLHPSAARGQALLGDGGPPAPAPPRPKPRLKKLRLVLILLGLTCLAGVSTVFGMMMAVASDLPSLENTREFRAAENSLLYQAGPGCKEPGRRSCQIAKLTGNQNRILADENQISPYIKNAVIAVEDRRYYEHEGVDYLGIGRALWQDILRRQAVQGGSTITQQFVKNALSAQGDRSVFQKLREAALSYHLEREWSKDKILTQYLNTVYFGNGAYGIEAAVRTYFGDGDVSDDELYYGTSPDDEIDPVLREAIDVAPAEAALLAGMIASPGLYDPVENRKLAKERRDLVLARMLDQRTITRAEYAKAIDWDLPKADDISPPDVESEQPFFTSWLTQQLVDRYGPGLVFGGGLKVKTTIDPTIQQAAEDATARVSGVGPDVSLVAIENKTGKVKAMVGGSDFDASQFNLATNGHRQPGSAMKPFILVRALQDGVDPNSTWASQPKEFPVPGSKKEVFPVANYEDSYSGVASLWSATAASDNSVYAELGLQTGTRRIARMARRMGIRTKMSTNPAMTLGGLEIGVTPLEMAYAYSTIANRGERRSGTLAANGDGRGPVGIAKVVGKGFEETNRTISKRVFDEGTGQMAQDMLSLVVSSGTGKAAQVAGETIWGKTGTTENYGDAWFVGSNGDLTVAVWVGYADKLIPMEYEFGGSPVAGGTYPAEIFASFMSSWVGIREQRQAASGEDDEDEDDAGGTALPAVPVAPSAVPPAEQQAAPAEPAPVAPETEAPAAPQEQAPPQPPVPAPAPEPTPAPAPTAPPSTGGQGGGVAPSSRRPALGRPPHRPRPGPRHVRAVRVAETPGQVRRLGDPDALAGDDAGLARPLEHLDRAVDQRGAVQVEPHPECLGELPGAGAEVLGALEAAPGAHQVETVNRLEGADQDRGPRSRRLGHGVQQRMDAVGEVHVGPPGLAEQRVRAAGQPDVRVAGGLVHVVALGLDHPAGRPLVADRAADQAARDVVHRALVEGPLEPHGPALDSTRRAFAICSPTRSSAVPPSETFDSSHAPCSSSSPRPESSWGASSRRSCSVRPESPAPRSSALRTSAPTMPWASRNGTPRRTSRSATSVAAISSSAAAAAIRSRSKLVLSSIAAATRRQSSRVSMASKSGSLSSWRSLL